MVTPKKRRTYKAKMRRINISINDGLLSMVDEAAIKDFTTRSDIIRAALLWYLRPQGRDVDQSSQDEIFKTLKNRKDRASMKKMFKDLGMN